MNDYGLTFNDIAGSYEGELPEDQREWVETKIGEAIRLLQGICPKLRDSCSLDHPRADLVRDVVTRAVLRVVRDEDPTLKTESENGYSYSKNALTASGDLWFPEKDLAALRCGPAKAKIGSAKTAPDPVFASPRRVTRRGGWW